MLRPTKIQAIQIVTKQAPQLLEIFRDFQASNGGWLKWPVKLLEIKKNLKVDNYVTLYEDKKRIDISFCLGLVGKDAFLEENEKLKKLTPEESEKYLVEFTQEIIDMDMAEFDKSLPNLHPTKEQEELDKLAYEALTSSDRAKVIEQAQFFYQFLFSSIHNYFSIMVCGEAMTSLIPKALAGDNEAFCRAVKIDRNLIFAHPYFIERYNKAQMNGEEDFLRRLSSNQSKPNLVGKISYPGLYVVFAMLEATGWLNDLKHSEILDICDAAGLDRWQNRIEDESYLTKRLLGYRRYQNTNGLSMHSK